MTFYRRAAAVAAWVALAVSAPAHAACWADQEREAVSVRELQTMLMVTSLRCHAIGIDIVPAYNGFVQAARGSIETANQRIKRHFAEARGTQVDYDAFTTLLANAYGAEATDAATCAEAADTARQAAASTAELVRTAGNRVFPRALPGGGCAAPDRPIAVAAAGSSPAVALAAADPARPATIVTIAAPPAPRGTVTLPDDVVAALGVLARYRGGAPTPKIAAVDAPTLLAQLPTPAAR